ncbi:unnamed protein product [Polarella glacialis]|uniref:B30.2/SPRY domain-containing protein n=2 Tax=Polarella glacialis TaxID=89957 RepID=A0A813H5W7_POLGL|nr:unnamed protein product [Polarella glacialis]
MAPKAAKKPETTKEEAKPEEVKQEEAKKEEPKAEEPKTEEPAKDVEMKEEAKVEEKKEPEKPKEQEVDAADIKGAKVKEGSVAMNLADSTLNVLPTAGGRLLRTLSEGGMQYLLASVRGNAGVKAGRYMFETRIVENLNPSEGHSEKTPQPRQLVRVGFSLAGSSLFLADGVSNCCFDSEGFFVHEKTRKKVGPKFGHDVTVAVLLNLDASSPNANTVSLFVDGVRASQPQPLPAQLLGKPLFPTITYKNVSVDVNFGPKPRKPLPFVCHMLAGAAAADVDMVKPKAKGGKPEVVFAVGLPEQGFFDWVDEFVEKNPGYTELSDRMIIEWASKSGVWKPKAGPAGSNDKPQAQYGIAGLDDGSVRKVLKAISPALQRNFVVPELKGNLLSADRQELLQRFSSQDFQRKAVVVMGEPSKDYKARVHSLLLAEKQAKADVEKKKKVQEEERNRLLELRKRKAEEAKKAKEVAQKKKAGEEVEEAKEEEETKAEAGEDAKMEEAAAPVELTDEEKKQFYRKSTTKDLGEQVLAKAYASFSVPSKAEGFDDVTFAWQPEAACTSLLQAWVLEKKLTSRAEDLTPGESFKEAWTKWQKTLAEWRRRQTEYKDPAKRKAAQAKKLADSKKKLEDEKKKLIEAGDEDGAKALDAQAEQEAKPMEIDVENLDVFTVEDVTDLGNGEPLFAEFLYEDWILLSTRYELHLLLHSFKKDLNDTDRPSFGEKHLAFYYNKYFKKNWNLQQFGTKTFEDFIELIKDSTSLDAAKTFLKAEQVEDTPIESFLKLTEDHRRDRQRRVDAGDETAQLKFSRPAPPPRQGGAPSAPAAKGGGKGGGGKGAPAPATSYGGSYAAQKRPYSPAPSAYDSSKQPRTTYGGKGGGASSYGGGYSAGGGSSYYSRR